MVEHVSSTTFLVATSLTAAACFVGYSLWGISRGDLPRRADREEKFPVFKKPASSSSNVVKEGSQEDSSMRGYKKTSDGRTTSYFSRELSEEDKRLLAATNTGPQRIDSSSTDKLRNTGPIKIVSTGEGLAKGGSQWNSAGTYEEKDISRWARDHLHSLLAGLAVPKAGGTTMNAYVGTGDAVKVTGDASCVFSRGKYKFIYDLSVEVEFLLTCDSFENASFVAIRGDTKGKITISDITADLDIDLSISDVIGRDSDRRKGCVFRNCVGVSTTDDDHTSTLLHAIGKILKNFLSDLQKEYERE